MGFWAFFGARTRKHTTRAGPTKHFDDLEPTGPPFETHGTKRSSGGRSPNGVAGGPFNVNVGAFRAFDVNIGAFRAFNVHIGAFLAFNANTVAFRGKKKNKKGGATRGLPRGSPILVLLSPKHA